MPLACVSRADGPPAWAGADTVLGPLADGSPATFELRAHTLCRRLLVEDGSVTGADIVDLATGRESAVEARAVVVAGDAFRTPQLLWASGIRPAALGRYLNDQPQVIAAAQVAVAERPTGRLEDGGLGDARDRLTGVSWVPFVDGVHPFHGQVMQIDASPIALGVEDESASIVGLGWFCAKEPRAEDRVAFSDAGTDAFGMPAMTIHYALTPRDHESVRGAVEALRRAAAALGGLAPRGEPKLLPAGSSLHYQGTVRMGAVDDGTSVCDDDSRVWGYANLFVGGNGVIPTATACNPTLTSVALAVRAARRIERLLAEERTTHAH
jgi:choline dehydrogenase-like flavoprotein